MLIENHEARCVLILSVYGAQLYSAANVTESWMVIQNRKIKVLVVSTQVPPTLAGSPSTPMNVNARATLVKCQLEKLRVAAMNRALNGYENYV